MARPQLRTFANVAELHLGALLGDVAEFPGVAREEDRGAVAVLGHAAAIGRHEGLEVGLGLGRDPARRLERRGFEVDMDVVLGLDPGLQHVELQFANHAHDMVAADDPAEHLRHALFRQILQRAPQLLGLHRILQPHAAQDFRREVGDADDLQRLAFGQRVADPQHAVVGNADDVAGPGLVDDLALAGEEQDRRIDRQHLRRAHLRQLHATAELAAAQAQEGDAVAMVGVHVGLDLEHEARNLGLGRLDRTRLRGLRPWRRRPGGDRVEQFLHAEIVVGRTEEHRRQMASTVAFEIERGIARAHQFDFLGEIGIGDLVVLDHLADPRLVGVVEHQHAVVGEIVGALEVLARAGGPGHRRDVERQGRGDLVQKLDRVLGLAVHLVDEGDDRHVTQAADLEQLAGARLDALGGVDHHHRRIDGGQGAVGVLGEVLVTRRVEQVEDRAAILEMHHRGGDRDAALLLDLHPVRARPPRLAARLHGTGDMDGAAEQQQLFRQRRLAGVGMRDDRKRAPLPGGMAGQTGVGSGKSGGIGHFSGVLRGGVGVADGSVGVNS